MALHPKAEQTCTNPPREYPTSRHSSAGCRFDYANPDYR
jgi:hypothetical protein